MDYTDIEKQKAVIAAAKAKLLLEQTKSFWLNLKESDSKTTEANFEELVQKAKEKLDTGIRDGFDTKLSQGNISLSGQTISTLSDNSDPRSLG